DAQVRAVLNSATAGTTARLFTGNSADTSHVYISGRDNNSGTRVNTLGTTGFGIFSGPNMIQVNADGSMKVQGDAGILGDYGYSGGGAVATQMGVDLTQGTSTDTAPGGTGGHFTVLGYLGVLDAATAVANGGTLLTYNGVAFSTANIKQGLYTFWGNEFVLKK